MKLQHLTIIFVVIIIPITLILSAYIGNQIDTASLQQSYNTKLMDATHDAVVAFELNTSNNIYTGNADSVRRDISAAINTFSNTLATNLGMSSANKESLMPYIPAILITLYDGYYIYSPSEYTYKTKIEKEGQLVDDIKTGYTHILKPYIYYSKKYESENDYIIVNYTLDNYITVYGKIGNTLISRSGYLSTEEVRDSINEGENLTETIKYKYQGQLQDEDGNLILDANNNPIIGTLIGKLNNVPFVYRDSQKVYYIDDGIAEDHFDIDNGLTIKKEKGWYTLSDLTLNKYSDQGMSTTDYSAKDYRDKSDGFMKYITKSFDGRKISDIVKVDGKEILNPATISDGITNDFENPESLFNQHKREVIRNSIQDNMNNAMAIYNANTGSLGTSSYFSMPKLSETDWEKIVTNVNIVTFMQGLSVGTKTYNDYAIVTSTNNKQYVDPNTIYFVKDGYYHTLEHMANISSTDANNIIGYKYADFKKVKYEVKDLNDEVKERYYYRRQEYACYDCIVSTNNIGETKTRYEILNANGALKRKYYTALARERFNLDKPTKIFLQNEF